jgi:hypothetical protein
LPITAIVAHNRRERETIVAHNKSADDMALP